MKTRLVGATYRGKLRSPVVGEDGVDVVHDRVGGRLRAIIAFRSDYADDCGIGVPRDLEVGALGSVQGIRYFGGVRKGQFSFVCFSVLDIGVVRVLSP